ncbi:DUF4124 domain-containing protein [Parasulfuritortus cantonensis]|uniref:DUF4124 domain-containing protein n=1 Tax=Parasulfuritortus cantonensis TaxID=2528202 RepID=A0A4R1B7W6_9PROT|nr:DUF4124 domain-containing protein [Parasulfuritortus cantonensis]TCJ12788.1 DUF4124 domain-containing protein [Parasulfuritortus cantonensis]
MGGNARSHRPLSGTVRRGLIPVALAFAAQAAHAETYRWRDEKGVVHYGDSMPAQYAGQAYEQLSSQGRVVKRVERAPTDAEERARREREAARREAEARAERERQLHDSALLATYASVRDVDVAENRALAQETAALDSLRILRAQPGGAAEGARLDAMIQARQDAIAGIRARFSADRARYQELNAGR